MAATVALLTLQEPPSWLAWCPPWLAAVMAAVLSGSVTVVVERWTARRHAEADRQQQDVDRLRQHLGRRKALPRIGELAATASALRVHPAPSRPGPTAGATAVRRRRRIGRAPKTVDAGLPLFVERTRAPEIRDWMQNARTDGGFLILVGDSCVGKTRVLYETARRQLSDFAVLAPDLGDGGLINTIALATFPLPRLIVWLDELQRFLPGPYLGSGNTAITASAVRRLLDAPTPVVIVGTLWPDHAETLRAGGEDPQTGRLSPRHPEAVDILADRRVHEVRLDSFSTTERAEAARLAAHDPVLAAAVADRDYNVTEALAGARELVNRYQRATSAQRAVIHAAIDTRRLGVQGPLAEDLLRAAARGYLSTTHPDDTWFAPVLAELTSQHRPQDRATAPNRRDQQP